MKNKQCRRWLGLFLAVGMMIPMSIGSAAAKTPTQDPAPFSGELTPTVEMFEVTDAAPEAQEVDPNERDLFASSQAVPEDGSNEDRDLFAELNESTLYRINVPSTHHFTAPRTGTYTVTTSKSSSHVDIDTMLNVGGVTNDDYNGTTYSQVRVNLNAGGRYAITTTGYGGRTGGCALRIDYVGSSGGTGGGTGGGSQTQTLGYGSTTINVPGTFTFRPTVSGTHTFTTSISGSSMDTMLDVGGATNDDYNGTLYSQIVGSVTAGSSYTIRVTGYNSASGRCVISIVAGNASGGGNTGGGNTGGGNTGNVLNCWWADRTFITIPSTSSITTAIQYRGYSSNTNFSFERIDTYMTNAANAWRAQGIPVTHSSSMTGAQILYRTGTKATLEALYPGVDLSGVYGLMDPGGASYVELTTENFNGTKSIRRTSSGQLHIYLINNFSNRGIANYQRTFTHELGHALGFRGHNTDSVGYTQATMPVMVGGQSGTTQTVNTSIRASDINHIKQVYNRYNTNTTRSLFEDVSSEAGVAVAGHSDHVHNSLVSSHANYEPVCLDKPYANLSDLFADCNTVLEGTPIEVVSGADQQFTTYKFHVNQYLAGGNGEKTITLKTQFGNVLDIGNTYVLAGNFHDSAYAVEPIYVIFTDMGVISVSDRDLFGPDASNNKADAIANLSALKAMPTSSYYVADRTLMGDDDFVNGLEDFSDYIVELRVDSVIPNSGSPGSITQLVDATLVKMHKGDSTKMAQVMEGLALFEGVEAGKTYLVFFTQIDKMDDSSIVVAAKDGAIIEVGSQEYKDYAAIVQ